MAWYAMRRFRHDGVNYTAGRQVVGQPLARLENWAAIGLVERRADPPPPPEPAKVPPKKRRAK